jgi:hypothetical protein
VGSNPTPGTDGIRRSAGRMPWIYSPGMQEEMGDSTRSDRVTTAAFMAMVLTIGGNVIAIKFVLREPDLDPLWAAASRFLLATVIFAVIASALHAPLPRGRALIGAVLYGAL